MKPRFLSSLVFGLAASVLCSTCGGGDQGPDVTPASIVLTPSSASLQGGGTTQLSAVVKNAGGDALTGQTVTYRSSATSIATVTSAGLVTALGPAGTANITASVGAITSPAVIITVTAGPATSVAIATKLTIVNVGSTFTPAVVAKDANGNAISSPSLTYASRTAAAATVSSSGVVTGIGQGQSMIVAAGTSGSDSTLAVVASVGGPVLMTDLTTFELSKGATFSTTIIMDVRASNEKLGSTTVKVDWDPTLIVYVSSASTGTGPSSTVNSTSASSGTLSFSVADATGFSGQVKLLTITYTAASTAGKVGSLKLSTSEVTGAGTFTSLTSKTVAVNHPLITK